MTRSPAPRELAAVLATFVDVLLPGDDLFPAASATGTHGLVADRVRALVGNDELAALAHDLEADGLALSEQSPDRRIASAQRFELEAPERFAFFRDVVYYAYYQSPLVTTAIRALGHDYHDAPQPLGYRLAPFDPTPGANAPAIPRGRYKRTGEVTRINVSGLSVLRTGAGGKA